MKKASTIERVTTIQLRLCAPSKAKPVPSAIIWVNISFNDVSGKKQLQLLHDARGVRLQIVHLYADDKNDKCYLHAPNTLPTLRAIRLIGVN